jgi:Thioredoxin
MVPTIRSIRVPIGHTPEGGVLVGAPAASRQLVLFEDPQCPYCRKFERVSGDLLARMTADGVLGIEYRMRCFLGPESIRACNALAAATEGGRFDPLRRTLFAHQPPEQSGGFTHEDLVQLGHLVGLDDAYEQAVREARYEPWVVRREQTFDVEDPEGTPFAVLGGRSLDSRLLYDKDRLRAVLSDA